MTCTNIVLRALQELSSVMRTYQKLQSELELKQHSLQLLQERIAGSEVAQLGEAVAAQEAQLGEANAAAESAREKKGAMVEEAKRLESEIKNFGKEVEKRIKVCRPT